MRIELLEIAQEIEVKGTGLHCVDAALAQPIEVNRSPFALNLSETTFSSASIRAARSSCVINTAAAFCRFIKTVAPASCSTDS